MDPVAYLGRIGFRGHLRTDLETLSRLQVTHLWTVPFENLDMGTKIPIHLATPRDASP